MIDHNDIDLALHRILHMVSVAIDAAEHLNGCDTDKDMSVMPYEKHDLLDFALFDIEKRLKALRQAMDGAT